MRTELKVAIHETIVAAVKVLSSHASEKSVETAKSQLRQAVRKLRQVLEQQESNDTVIG